MEHLSLDDGDDDRTQISAGPLPFATDSALGGAAFSSTVGITAPPPPPTPAPPAPAATAQPPRAAFLSTVLPRIAYEGAAAKLVHTQEIRYASMKALGAGAAGDVVLVRDNDIDRPVAMKRLRAHRDDLAALARFAEEVKTIGQLEHPGIVPIHDVGIDDQGRYFFIMKYVDGQTLESIIDKLRAGDPDTLRRFSIEQRVSLFTQVLRAVHFAHSRGYIHRDLKPANIMIGNFGEVMVMDWGLAKRVGAPSVPVQPGPAPAELPEPPSDGAVARGAPPRFSTTRIGQLVGTPAYMAPEQAAGDTDRVDARSDIYSLCVLFHELLTLRYYLADKQTLQGLLFAVMNEPPPDLHAARLPQEFIHFLRRGLSKDPAQRFQSVAQMLDELQAIAEGRIHVECAFTAMRRTGNEFNRMVRDRPMMALTAFGLLIGMALFGVVAAVLMIALSR